MEKKYIDKSMIRKHSDHPFKWKDIKDLDLQDEDIIRAEWVEPFFSENNSYEGHYMLEIVRKVLETDEQFEKRKAEAARDAQWAKERRRESYLKLKKEFENE